MPYLIVDGTFHIQGKRPDGDTVSFRPHKIENWLKLTGVRVPRMNANGKVNLRFEAIDALETHYRGRSWLREVHQPSYWAYEARDFMLRALDIDPQQVTWRGDVVASAPDGVPGFIATNGVDPYHRPIVFVFAGEPFVSDGEKVHLEPEHIAQSVNYALIQAGLVYPTFYTLPYPDLREPLAAASAAARQAGLGLWMQDASMSGVVIPKRDDLTPITTEYCLLPKLFRRLVTHLGQRGSVRNFKGFLHDQPDPALRTDICEFAAFSRFIEVEKGPSRVYLKVPPEKLVFVPR